MERDLGLCFEDNGPEGGMVADASQVKSPSSWLRLLPQSMNDCLPPLQPDQLLLGDNPTALPGGREPSSSLAQASYFLFEVVSVFLSAL